MRRRRDRGRVPDPLGYADGERVFAPCPMVHTASTRPMAATIQAFGIVVSMGHFDPGSALEPP